MKCPSCSSWISETSAHCPRCGVLLPTAAGSRLSQFLSEHAPAPLGLRAMALLIDLLFAALIALPCVGLIMLVAWAAGGSLFNLPFGLAAVAFVAFPMPPLVYFFCRDGLDGGAGWGKRICGLRVIVVSTGSPCTLWKAFVRTGALLCFAFALPSLPAMLADPLRRRFGEAATGTAVVLAQSPRGAPEVNARTCLPEPLSTRARQQRDELDDLRRLRNGR